MISCFLTGRRDGEREGNKSRSSPSFGWTLEPFFTIQVHSLSSFHSPILPPFHHTSFTSYPFLRGKQRFQETHHHIITVPWSWTRTGNQVLTVSRKIWFSPIPPHSSCLFWHPPYTICLLRFLILFVSELLDTFTFTWFSQWIARVIRKWVIRSVNPESDSGT